MFILMFAAIFFSILMLLFLCSIKRSWITILTYIDIFFLLFFYMVFILKTGGYNSQLEKILILSPSITKSINNIYHSFNSIYYMLTICRLLFPYLLLCSALLMEIDEFENLSKLKFFNLFIPVILFAIILEPRIYRHLFGGDFLAQSLVQGSEIIMLLLYCFIAFYILIKEIQITKLKYAKKQNSYFLIASISLFLVYLFFSLMDPIFFIQDYTSIRVGPISYFLNSKIDLLTIITLLILVLLAMLINFVATFKFSQIDYSGTKLDLKIRKNLKEIQIFTGGLMHGLKNQLLTENVLLNNLIIHLENPEERRNALVLAKSLKIEHQATLHKINLIFQSFKDIKTHLVLDDLGQLMSNIEEVARHKYPDTLLLFTGVDGKILMDRALMIEAIMNLIDNAVEAIGTKPDGYICVDTNSSSKHYIINVIDNGQGIPAKMQKKIFLPFTTDKNMQHNWGLGLCYTRQVIKKHFGDIRFESDKEKGTAFIISIPKLFR